MTYAKLDSQPSVDANDGGVLDAVFDTSQSLYDVDAIFRSGAREATMTVKKADSRWDIQRECCKASQQT